MFSSVHTIKKCVFSLLLRKTMSKLILLESPIEETVVQMEDLIEVTPVVVALRSMVVVQAEPIVSASNYAVVLVILSIDVSISLMFITQEYLFRMTTPPITILNLPMHYSLKAITLIQHQIPGFLTVVLPTT